MNFGGLAAGLYGGMQGYNSQVELERKRDREDAAAKIEAENQQWMRDQRQRVQAEQDRASKFRSAVAGISPTKQVDVLPTVRKDDEGNDMPAIGQTTVPRRQDEILKDYADAAQKYGNDPMAAFKARADADQARLAEATRRMSQVIGQAKGKSAAQIVQEAADIYNNDPLDGEVSNIQPSPDGMGATVTFKNRANGQTMVKEFKTPDEAINGLRSYLDPAGAQALLQAKQAAELKVWEEQAKAKAQRQAEPLKAGPGETVVPGVDDPRRTLTVPPLPTRTGDGSGSGSGKGEKTPYALAREIMADAFEKGDVKAATPAQRSDSEDFLDRIMQANPTISPARAVKIAVRAATDPASSSPKLDEKTGRINLVFKDTDGSTYTLFPGYTTASELEARGFDKKAIAESVQQMVSKQGDATMQKTFVAAAFDPSTRDQVVRDIKSGAQKSLDEYLKRNAESPSPRPEQEIRAAAQALLAQNLEAVDRKFDLVRQHIKPPSREPSKRLQSVGGLGMSGDFRKDYSQASRERNAEAMTHKPAGQPRGPSPAEQLAPYVTEDTFDPTKYLRR